MKRILFKMFVVLMVLSMVVGPVSANNLPDDIEITSPPPRTPTELPQEIIDEFRDGMTIEEFLIRNQGPIPNALLKYTDIKSDCGSSIGNPIAHRIYEASEIFA